MIALQPPQSPGTYFVRRGNDGPIKIGRAKSIAKRVSQLLVSSPDPLVLLAVVPQEDAESIMHDRFATDRLRGEWFAASNALLAFIAETQASNIATGICHPMVPNGKHPGGRPPVAGETRSERVEVRMTADERERAQRAASEHGEPSLADWVRRRIAHDGADPA